MLDNLPEWLRYVIAIALVVGSYIVTGRWLAQVLFNIAGQTETTYDNVVLKRVRPRRLALIAPLLVIYVFAYLIPDPRVEDFVRTAVLFLGLWLLILTVTGLLDAINDIYESRRDFSGVAIKGYLDLITILAVGVGIIVSIALITGQSPIVLLTGLGALTAVLLLIFRDTILSLVASVHITTNDLVKEGDWLEVPSFDADGEVIDISLHQVKIQNGDKTISFVPTYKLMEVAYKNWRGVSDSGGRRIKRSIYIDEGTIRFCTPEDIERLKQIPLISDYMEQVTAGTTQANGGAPNSDRSLTNVGVFRVYIDRYLRHHPCIREDMSLVVRQRDPSPEGLPIELYAFTDTVVWNEYEDVQAEIFDHLLAVVPDFGLRVFQQPTGADFARFMGQQH